MTTHNKDNTLAKLRALNEMHANDGGDVAKIGRELASAGLRPMLIQGKHHGSGDSEKLPVTPAQLGVSPGYAEEKWGGAGGWKLHARSRAEWDDMTRRAKQKRINRPGLGISLGDGDGQVVCLDADTPAEREALSKAWVAWGGDPKIAETLSETTPGKLDKDGKARHTGGGHIWAVLPEPVELSALGGTRLVDAEGNIFKKGKGKGTGAALMVTKCYVVVAPTERTEGAYTKTGGAVEAPAGLVELINAEIEAERRGAEEKARRAAERAELPVDLEDGSLAEWARDTEWAELLTPAGWTLTGRDNTCGCEVWEKWGGGGSTSRSAVAHEPSCAKPYWEMREGHAPLHIFSTSLAEGDPLQAMYETYGVDQKQNLTKPQVFAATAYPELEPGEAIWAAFQDQGWGDPDDAGIFLQTYEGAVTGGATDIAAVVGLMDDYEAPEAPNEAPAAGVAAENTPNNPAGESAAGGGDVTGGVTPGGTEAGTAAGTQGATQGGTGRTRLGDFMPREEVYPETPECVAFIEEIERDLDGRPRTADQRAEAAKLFSLAKRNPRLTPGDERDELWGGVPGWSAGTVADLMGATPFTRDVFWWVEDNARGRNPVAVLLLVLLHVGARLPVSVGPAAGPKSLPGPMSMLAILVGESGSGKTGANEAAKAYCAARGLYDPMDAEDEGRHNGAPLGTPQALARKLMVERPTTKPGAREGETVETKETVMRTNPSLFLWDDEMRSLLDGQRESWGTATMITSSWSGQDFLPSTNTGGKVPVTGNYSLFVGGAIQGSSAAGLLESEDLGLLQRAILVPARWPLAGLLDERDIPRPEAPPAADQVAVAEVDRVVVRAELWPGLVKVHRMAADAIPGPEKVATGTNFNRARRWALPATEDVLNRIAYEGKGSNSEDAGSYGGGGAGGQTLASRARLASLLTVASWSEGRPMIVGGLEWAWASMLMELVTAPTLTYAKYKAKEAATRRAEREGEMLSAKNAAVDAAYIERVQGVVSKIRTAFVTKDRVSKSELNLSRLQGAKAWDDAVRWMENAGECHKDPNARKGSVVLLKGEDPKRAAAAARRAAAAAAAAAGTPAVGTPAGGTAAAGTPAEGTAGGSVTILKPLPGANEIGFPA